MIKRSTIDAILRFGAYSILGGAGVVMSYAGAVGDMDLLFLIGIIVLYVDGLLVGHETVFEEIENKKKEAGQSPA